MTIEVSNILEKIYKEVEAQHEKWGRQNHPFITRTERVELTSDQVCKRYCIPTETQARDSVETQAKAGELTFADILLEEVSEAISAKSVTDTITELIQVAAVCVSAIDSIQRNAE